MNINTIILGGNLTRDPELRYVPSGDPVCNMRLACNRKFTRDGKLEEEVLFIDVAAWGKQAESCSEYLAKGSSVVVEGRLRIREWETKEGEKRLTPEVVATRVHFGDKVQQDSE